MIFNDLFCLLRPEVHTLSLGVANPEDFDEHLKAWNSGTMPKRSSPQSVDVSRRNSGYSRF